MDTYSEKAAFNHQLIKVNGALAHVVGTRNRNSQIRNIRSELITACGHFVPEEQTL